MKIVTKSYNSISFSKNKKQNVVKIKVNVCDEIQTSGQLDIMMMS